MNKENEIQRFYNENPYPNKSTTIEAIQRHKWILNSLPRPIKPGSKILDVGCGTGEISCFLSRYGDVTGFDFSENSLKLAEELKKKLGIKNVDFKQKDITKTKGKAKYDYIFCIGVLHHIPDAETALENIKSFLKKDGLLIVAVTNKYVKLHRYLLTPKRNKLKNKDYFYNPYRIFYTKKQFVKLLKKHGFEIIGMWRNIPEIVRLLTGKGVIMTFCVRKKSFEK